MRIFWTDTALESLEAVPADIGTAVLRKLKLAARFPEMHPERQRGRYRGYRWFPVGDWLVLYRVVPNRLVVMTVLHGARSDA